MLVVAIDYSKDDNPDLPEPYLIETTYLPDKFRQLIEKSEDFDIDIDDYEEFSEFVFNNPVSTPIEGRIEKFVTIWY